MSAAGIVGDRLIVATVGDSRAYVLRSGELVQVTRDQSLSSALLAAGHDRRARRRARVGAILQALGVGDDVEPSLSIIELRRGDRVLLCSDGLHGLVGDPALALLHVGAAHRRARGEAARHRGARGRWHRQHHRDRRARSAASASIAPTDDDDLPTFREFDPQKEGDPALTSTSYVARRLAARIGIPTSSIPPSIPVTGQHAVLRSRIGIRVPADRAADRGRRGPGAPAARTRRRRRLVVVRR